MSVDDGGMTAGHQRGSGRVGVRQMKDRLREQGRELAELRRENDELRAQLGSPGQPESAPFPDSADPRPPDGTVPAEPEREPVDPGQEAAEREAAVEAEVAAARAAYWDAAGLPANAAMPPPVGIPPEALRAQALTEAAAAGAQAPTDNLDGLYHRLQDRSVPWPQLQAEMRAMNFRDPVEAASWDRPKR